jgi:hypothetical protein
MSGRNSLERAVLDARMAGVKADEAMVGKCRDGFVGAQSFGFIFMVSSFIVFSGWILTHLDGVILSDRLSLAIATAGVSAFMLMAGSARIFVRDAHVYVVSFLFTFVVPVEEIVALKADNGFGIQVVSGRVIDSMAFGSSLIAMFTGNRRGRRAARRLTELCGPFTAVFASDLAPGPRHRAGGPDATRSRIRLGMLSLACGLVAAAAAAATVIQDAPVHL